VSIKNKLVTAVTTAGLLAGLFGSAFVPAARGASTDVDATAIKASFAEAEDGYTPATYTPTGSATKPYVLYAPDSNDGLAAETAVLDFVCFEIAEADLVDKAGDPLSDQDDVTASVTAAGNIIFQAADSALASDVDTTDEDDYGTAAYTDSIVEDGIAFCATVADDDLTGSGVVTVKVNNVTVRTVNIKVVGPAVKATPASLVGGWVAMNNIAVASAMSVAYTDAAGTNLYTAGISVADIDTYVLRGHEGGAGIDYYLDDVSTGATDNTTDVTIGTSIRRIDVEADFCDDANQEIGDTRTVYVVLDYSDNGTKGSSDVVSNGVSIRCSDEAANWELTGLAFEDATVDLGGYTYLTITVEDGSGNPLGVGVDADLTFNGTDNAFTMDGDATIASFFPIEATGGIYDEFAAQLWTIDADAECDSDNTTVDNSFVGDDTNLLEAGKVFLCYQASYNESGTAVIRMPLDVYEGSSADLVAQQTVSASITVVDPTEGAGAVVSTAATIARNAAKSIATITIPAAAGKLVTITIENVKTGATKTYYRKAAAVTGVAKFTLRKAGKWEVFASYSNLVTDTVKLKK
jgi:hypothetical protein